MPSRSQRRNIQVQKQLKHTRAPKQCPIRAYVSASQHLRFNSVMPKSPQDIYARHLVSPRGYPLWMPEPSIQLLAYRRDGLRIGDVGVVIPEDGCFDVFFNICLSQHHPFHRATGVPDNFEPIELSDMEIRTAINAENPGRIIATSSVKTVRTIEPSGGASSSTRSSSGLEYEFNLSSSEGALLILPEGAERHDLRNHHRFLEAATQHGADWYRFAEEKVGQIISRDSLYLITGMSKTRSWSLAAFEKTAGSGEYPAQCTLSQGGGNGIGATCTWDTTRTLDWRVGPIDNYGIPNQAVFIRGFKIAHRTGMFGTRWISVKADVPSTRQNTVESFGAVPGDSWLAYIFGGLSTGRTTESSISSGTRDEMAANPALDAARNEIQNNGALAVGKDVVIQRTPEASQIFHPSDVINQYLLNEAPSANIAVTHDNEWITLLEENLLRPEDLMQEGLLEALISKNYHVISEAGAVYLRSGSANGLLVAKALDDRFYSTRNNDPGTPDDLSNKADATVEGPEFDSQGSAVTTVNPIPPAEQGCPRIATPPTEWDRIIGSGSSVPSGSLDPQDNKVILAGISGEKKVSAHRKGPRSSQVPDSSHRGTPPEQSVTNVHDHHGPTSSMSWVQPGHPWTITNPHPLSPAVEYFPHGEVLSDPEMPAQRTASQPHDKSSWVDRAKLYIEQSQKPSPKVGDKLNPLLVAPANERGQSPDWIMCSPARQHNFGIASSQSWVEARNMPATQPSLKTISIICRAFPGIIHARAQDPGHGVTCGEVLDAISTFLDGDMQWEEYALFAVERRFKITAKPGGATLKRNHWLGTKRSFGGLVENEAFVKKRCGRALHGVYELICLPSRFLAQSP